MFTECHFVSLKKLLSKEVLLTYLNFNEPFDIHADASDVQLGAVISQNDMPIAFYSCKLNKAQHNYTIQQNRNGLIGVAFFGCVRSKLFRNMTKYVHIC